MKRVHLIHWNEAESLYRARRLKSAGFRVDTTPILDFRSFKSIRANPPDAFVIDLTRLPSHGREVALSLRSYKDTRVVPIVLVEGDPEKVERIKQLLPDATYTTWTRVAGALKRAIASPVRKPAVPSSTLAGYSGTPLPKKLGIKENSAVTLINAPRGFARALHPLPTGVRISARSARTADVTIWFVKSTAELRDRLPSVFDGLGSRRLWIAWPKKSAGTASDLSESIVRTSGLDAGLVDFKICAIDATWSGLQFTRRAVK
jgi:hypothetical protein